MVAWLPLMIVPHPVMANNTAILIAFPIQTIVSHQPWWNPAMPLSRADLEAIRAVVRDELQRANPALTPRQDLEREADPAEEDSLLAEWARAAADRLRGRPGAAERALAAEARYRIQENGWYASYARKLSRKAPDATITVDEMVRAMETRRRRRRKSR